MAQRLKVFAALPEDLSLVSAPMSGLCKLPVTTAPEDISPSSGYWGHCTNMANFTGKNKKSNFKKFFHMWLTLCDNYQLFLHLIFLFDILQVYPCPGLRTRPTSNNNPDLPIRLLFRGFFFFKNWVLITFLIAHKTPNKKTCKERFYVASWFKGTAQRGDRNTKSLVAWSSCAHKQERRGHWGGSWALFFMSSPRPSP